MIRRFFASVREWIELIDILGQLAMVIVFSLYLLYLLQPIAPIITLLFCLSMTTVAFDGNKLERIMAVGGLSIYASGWIVALFAGPIIGTLVCGIGATVWFQGVLWAAFPFRAKSTPSHA